MKTKKCCQRAKRELWDKIEEFFADEDIAAWGNYDEWVELRENELD